MHQTIERHPAVVLDLQPDGAVAFLMLARDVQGGADQARAQKLALPAGQGFAQRLFAQRQGRGAGRQAQGLAVQRARRPSGRGEQAVAAADDLQRGGLAAGGGRPGVAGRGLDIDHDGQQRAGDAQQAADGAAGRRGGRIVMGAGGGDAFRRRGAAALEHGQASIGQGLDAQGQGQARDGLGHRLGRHLRQLGQGVVQRQQVEQQLQPHLRRARGVGAVGGDRDGQGAGQAFQRLVADGGAGLAGQGAAGDGGGRQALGPAHDPARRPQQLARLMGQDVGQLQPLDLGRCARQPPSGAGQVIDAAGQDVGIPGEGGPAAEHLAPGQGHGQGLARPAIALGHHGGHPVEAVQLDREGAAGGGAVPQRHRAVGVQAQARQRQLA